MFVVAVLRRTVAVAATPVTCAIVDSVLEAILLRRIRAISAVATIAAAVGSAITVAVPVSISVAVPAPGAVVVAAAFPEAALVSCAICLAVVALTPPAIVWIKATIAPRIFLSASQSLLVRLPVIVVALSPAPLHRDNALCHR